MQNDEFQAQAYDVEIDGECTRIDRVSAVRHQRSAEDDTYLHLAERLLDRTESPRPAVGILGLIWRVLVRVLEKLGPTDPPHIIAVIKAPERMYCVSCGTQRVARYCPICGRDVDRQYRRLVRQMARHVVDGTADYREKLEGDMRLELEQQVERLRQLQEQMLKVRLAKIERDHTMELARHKKQLQAMIRALAGGVLREELKQVLAEERSAAPPPARAIPAGST